MNIERLFLFTDILETGSMTQTARRMHLSQSALTQQIKTLEQQIGVRLLERSNKGVRPTAAGEVVYKAALDIQEIYQSMARELELMQSDAQILRIAATNLVYTYALPCTLFDLKKRFPTFRIETIAMPSGQIEEKVALGKVDIGIIVSAPSDGNLQDKIVFSDRICLTAGREFTFDHPVTPDALYDLPLLLLSRPHRSRLLLENHLANMGMDVSRLHVIHSFDATETIRQSAINGFGLAFLPYSAIKKDLYNQQLQTVPISGFDLEYEYHMIARPAKENTQLSRLLAYLGKTLQDTIC